MENETREIADVANQLAQQSSAQSAVNGVLFENLLVALKHNGMLSQEEVKSIFRRAHMVITQTAKDTPNVREGPLYQYMVQILTKIAAGHGVEIP